MTRPPEVIPVRNGWSAVALQVIRVSGVVGLIAVIAVAGLGFVWHSTLRSIESRAEHVEGMMMRAETDMNAFVRRTETREQELMRVLMAMCVNAAETDEARDRCIGR